MSNDVKITGHTNLVKRNNAVIDNDAKAYRQALARRQKEKKIHDMIEKTEHLENKIKDLDNKLDSIIDILKGLST